MITLHKVEIDNVRSLGHAVFEPLVDGGMTALNGPNGAGKCLPGWVRVHDADTGEAVPIEQFVAQQRKRMLGYSAGKIQPVDVTDWMSLGKKPTVMLRLKNGVSMEVAETHPILTDRGCVRASDLQPGDWVAEARSLPEAGPARLSVDEAMLVGLLLGDGTLGLTSVQLTAGEEEVGLLFKRLVESLFPGLTVWNGTGAARYQWYVKSALSKAERKARVAALATQLDAMGVPLRRYTANRESSVRRGDSGFTWDALVAIEDDYGIDLYDDRCALWGGRALLEWTKELGIAGTKSATKHLPAGTHLMPEAQVRAMLAGLWLTDGWFTPKKGDCAYGTDSFTLAQDVRLLLLRLGMMSTLQTQVREDGTHYRVNVSTTATRRFGDIPLVGPKAERRDETVTLLAGRRAGACADMIPASFNSSIATTRGASGRERTRKQIAAHSMSREVFRDFGGDPTVAEADSAWVRVESVVPTGREVECYDVTVDSDEHLYVAETLIVHNSSVLSSVMWAMYGVTPDGVQQNAMRRQGSVGACRVVVEFEFNAQVVVVERGLKGRNDSPYLLITVNGIEQAKGSIKAGTAWLINLLGGLDAEAFMTAFVIRQKELDGLVKARPADRRKLIERLAGIDRMSTAVKSAREEETEVKKRLDLLPGDNDALEAAREALEAAQQAAADMWEAYEEAEAAADEASAALAAAEVDAKAMMERLNAHVEVERTLTAAKHAHAMAEQAVTNARNELAQVEAAAQGGSDADVAAAQDAYEQASAAVTANQQAREGADRAVQAATADAQRATAARQRAEKFRADADQTAQQAQSAAERANAFPADLTEKAQQVEVELAAAQARTGALRAEYERLTPSIKAMEATGGTEPCCPTCANPLPDPTLVLNTLRAAQEQAVTDGKAAAAQVKGIEQRLAALRQQATEAAAAREGATQVAARVAPAEQQADEAEREAAEAAATAQTSAEAAETAKAAALSAAQQTDTLKVVLVEAGEALRTAQVAAAAAARVPALTEALMSATEREEAAEQSYQTAFSAEFGARVPDAERTRVLEAHATAQQMSMLLNTRKAEANGNFRVAEEQVKSAERERDAEDLKMRARVETLALLEQKTAVREALDWFRKDRIASLAPELSEIATDLIAKMTDGKFVAVELDEEFTPVVTDAQGRMRPASWLSGGEESAVALSLRLAIGEVIAGSKGGLLWMDEPQTAMDAQRRPAMMSVLRDLNGRQVIIISHVTEATDMVDLVLEVIPDEEDGSTISPARALHDIEDVTALDAIA